MDSVFHNSYYKYFLWNDGLIDYYLSDRSGQEIMLYVDEKTLEHIAQKSQIRIEGDTYKDDFENCVIEFCKHYNLFLNSCKKPSQSSERLLKSPDGNKKKVFCKERDCKFYVFNSYCLPWSDRLDVLAIANHICTGGKEVDVKKADSEGDYKRNLDGQEKRNANNGIPYFKKDAPNSICIEPNGKAIKQELPFFAIVVYLILKFDNGETQQWDNIVGIRTSSREYIKDLWEAISSLYPSFKKDASAYVRIEGQNEDYVGRIKYHIMLSSSIRRKLNDAIFKTSIWKFTETMSFAEQKRRLLCSNTAIADYFSEKNIDDTIFDRKLQIVIEDFDLEDYLDKLPERRNTTEFGQTKSSTECFALAISYPEKNESGTPEIRMLTSVHQELHDQDYHIQECQAGSLDGFNVHFVKYRDSYNVNIEEHNLENNDYKIKCLPINDWMFFYEYHETLFIQTEDLSKSSKYIILVRDSEPSLSNFHNWMRESDNRHLIHYPKETTKALFGDNWVVYYSNRTINIPNINQNVDSSSNNKTGNPRFGGGIFNKDHKYYIQALPYIEIPERYGDLDDIAIRIKIHDGGQGYDYKDFDKRIISGRRLIVDLKIIQGITDQMSCAITLIIKGEEIPLPCITICGQDIIFDQNQLYKYDSDGRIVNNNEFIFAGNLILENDSRPVHRAILESHLECIDIVPDSMYLVNLISACCYNSPTLEISQTLFEKCLNYATTRIGMKVQNLHALIQQLSRAGYINPNYSTSKIQIVPPAFSKAPRSIDGNNQLLVLSGGYTKKFIVDLFDYCSKRKIQIYQRQNSTSFEGLIPPTILLPHNFNTNDFKNSYNHQFDVLLYNDFPLSLLMSSSPTSSLFNSFKFKDINDASILMLQDTTDKDYPRVRRDKNRHSVHYYIEKRNNQFAVVEKTLIPWAYLYCFTMRKCVFAVLGNYHIYIPVWYDNHQYLILPTALQRSLWMMNLGMPDIIKAFVCGNNDSSYYLEMYSYHISGESRLQTLKSKLGENVHEKIKTSFKMHLYTAKTEYDITEKKYLILYDERKDVIAIGFDSCVYIKWNRQFYRVEGGMNEIFSFLINKRWQVEECGLKENSNGNWYLYRQITNDIIDMPDFNNFNKETITIL